MPAAAEGFCHGRDIHIVPECSERPLHCAPTLREHHREAHAGHRIHVIDRPCELGVVGAGGAEIGFAYCRDRSALFRDLDVFEHASPQTQRRNLRRAEHRLHDLLPPRPRTQQPRDRAVHRRRGVAVQKTSRIGVDAREQAGGDIPRELPAQVIGDIHHHLAGGSSRRIHDVQRAEAGIARVVIDDDGGRGSVEEVGMREMHVRKLGLGTVEEYEDIPCTRLRSLLYARGSRKEREHGGQTVDAVERNALLRPERFEEEPAPEQSPRRITVGIAMADAEDPLSPGQEGTHLLGFLEKDGHANERNRGEEAKSERTALNTQRFRCSSPP